MVRAKRGVGGESVSGFPVRTGHRVPQSSRWSRADAEARRSTRTRPAYGVVEDRPPHRECIEHMACGLFPNGILVDLMVTARMPSATRAADVQRAGEVVERVALPVLGVEVLGDCGRARLNVIAIRCPFTLRDLAVGGTAEGGGLARRPGWVRLSHVVNDHAASAWFRRCRPPRSARTRRPPRSARRAPDYGPAISTRAGTSASCGPKQKHRAGAHGPAPSTPHAAVNRSHACV